MITELIVEENKDFIRTNGGIVNRNDNAYNLALKRRREKPRLDILEERIAKLESQVIELLQRCI